MRQADIAAPLCKAAWTSAGADALAADLARAWRCAMAGPRGFFGLIGWKWRAI